MSTNTNTDLTEEDAADLQFPKEQVATKSSSFLPGFCEVYDICSKCSAELIPPYILCVECEINICSACFANGVEFANHRNDHSYRVLNFDFVLFENSDWTAKEELILLETLLHYSNWNTVAKHLPGRSVQEVKEHYDYMYLQRRGSSLLPEIPKPETSVCPLPIVPYRFRLNIEEPPRYTYNSVGYHSVAGYNAARSDFELEYDTNAEDLVTNLKSDTVDVDDPDYEIVTDLQCAIVRSYNRRLRERQRRKAVIRRHGLILLRKTMSALHRYDMTITRAVYERLLGFMQFYENGMDFDYILEGLHRAGELKMQILRLCEFHQKGITTLSGAQLYLKLKKQHDESRRELQQFHSDPRFVMKNLKDPLPFAAVAKKRGTYTPIEIVGLPGYEKLQPKEMDLCRNVRLVPLTYLELRDLLIAENKKLGYLKLQTARRLLKIDVNKTRRLYDFLVQEGYVIKPK